ncbi:DUF4157 domain-containing protein [Rhodocytophaga rosea]|uniref:DUF4157 domain-containing protein n=1 Tax=Rhodocytophaga rosea TaxID=2704465 RepID=A0A6C0GSQ9_9BACT|nr:DUF4157 domain-containing protein [Rhodocytophaga rosea]QHT70500.1 DUF4157 domain-containing protein [Rhodocytophaga rosea]
MATETIKEQKGTILRKHVSRKADSNDLHSYGQAIEHSMNFGNGGYTNQVVQAMYGYSHQVPLQLKAEPEDEPQAPQEIPLQRKLTIGSPDDNYEKEADAIANQVMQMPEPAVQRKCAHCQAEEGKVQLKPAASSITPFIQTKASQAGTTTDAISHQLESSRGGGSPMADHTRNFMENRFGADFTDFRIHTGSQAVQLSHQLNAQAFTTGKDIYFNEGNYSPESSGGKHLLAHELTHTIQQAGLYRKKDTFADTCDPAAG